MIGLIDRSSMVVVLALALACGDDGGGGDVADSVEPTAGDDTGTASGNSGTSTSGGSATEDGSATATTSATASATAGSSDSGDGTSDSGGSSGGSDSGGMMVDCADATCGIGQVCINPCCGGPAPTCTDTADDGTCPGGETPVSADQCDFACTSDVCCPPTQCTPDPPFCAEASELMCNGTTCSHFECFGTLQDGELACECA